MATLVYHAGALGDFITALPSIAAWRTLHEGERAILLGKPVHGELVEPPFDAVRDAGSSAWAPLFAPGLRASGAVAEALADVRSAFLFSAASSPLAASLAALGVSEILRQDPFPASPVPIVDYHLSLFPPSVASRIGELPRVRARTDMTVPPECVALHPGSGSAEKCWPRERWIELGRWLRTEGRVVAWVTGPAEEDETTPDGMEAWRSVPLADLAGRLAMCAAFVGNDSGVTHLAAAAGCPTVALFGATNPRVWSPRGRRVTLVVAADERISGINSAEVRQACGMILAG
jgi:heptosyltransferase III